ncbi:hypothetical protein K3495_g13421 [Podosphaera aphanis]|nr:hypothetical protein K3495_g13421 [Podosphaera aphanis]
MVSIPIKKLIHSTCQAIMPYEFHSCYHINRQSQATSTAGFGAKSNRLNLVDRTVAGAMSMGMISSCAEDARR